MPACFSRIAVPMPAKPAPMIAMGNEARSVACMGLLAASRACPRPDARRHSFRKGRPERTRGAIPPGVPEPGTLARAGALGLAALGRRRGLPRRRLAPPGARLFQDAIARA